VVYISVVMINEDEVGPF